jgi:hypothetical protein
MKMFSTFILLLAFVGLSQAQSDLKNLIDVRIGYGGIDGLSGMTFLSAGYGRQIKNGFILKGSFMKGSGANELYREHSSIDVYGLSLQKAVNMSGPASINLSVGYRFIRLQESRYLTASFDPTTNEIYGRIALGKEFIHGVEVDLSYLHKFNDRIGIYAGANFTSGIAMFSVNAGTCVYF